MLRRLGAGGSILYETLAAQVYVHDLWSNTTVIASVTPDGFTAGNGDSFHARISADGRFVAFKSRATNLVDLADANGDAADIFVRDLSSGRTKVISIAPSGDRTLDHGVSDSGGLRMSTNGRYFAFETEAFDVVLGFNDTNHSGLVYWRDRLAATSVLVSRTLSGTFPRYGSASLADLSSDGRYVCFGSYLSNLVAGVIDGSGNPKVFIRDMQLDEAWVVTLSTNNYALSGYGTRFSGNGRHLLFHCDSTAVVPGVPDANGYGRDYFLHDVLARTNAIVTRSISGTGSDDAVIGGRARLSDDGRFVLFMSYGTNFIAGTATRSSRFYVRDMNANRTLNALQLAPQEPGPGFADTMYEISADGRAVAFLSVTNLDSGVVDGNSAIDLFVAPVYAPRLVGIHPSVLLIGEGIAGETYVVEASEDFSNWTTVNTNVADAAGLFEARDAQPGSGAKRFYRLSWK